MSETPEQKCLEAQAPTEKPASLTVEDAARLAEEGLNLRRTLEERVGRPSSPVSPPPRSIRFR